MLNLYKKDFPVLTKTYDGKPLIYLDNAATTQKPEAVLKAVERYYREENANPYRGMYDLSTKATKSYEDARKLTAEFIHSKAEEIIFTRNTTESLNLIAYSYGRKYLAEGDEVVVAISEHHSNILPWQQVTREKGAKLTYLYVNGLGQITEDEINKKITDKTKIVAIAQVSNVLGTIHPVSLIIEKAHKHQAVVVLDCAQSIPHYPLDVKALDVDFAAFSGHKMLGPMGIGVLYGKEEHLLSMPPFLTGGEMIEYVSEQEATFAPLPQKFEAGTVNVGGAVGLAEAIRYMNNVGYEMIQKIEYELTEYALKQLSAIPEVTVYGEPAISKTRSCVISFNINGIHPHDTASILDSYSIAIRAGHHCAQPLMKYMKLPATCRVSFYFYNTIKEVDAFINSLKNVRRWLNNGN